MAQNNSSLPPAAGNTTGGSTLGGSGATDFTSGSSASQSSSGGFSAGSDYSDTSRPTGSNTSSSYQPANSSYGSQSRDYGSESSGYQPVSGDVSYGERSQSRPSTAVIVGSAIAGAIAGGAIPFMLAGRKSNQKSTVVLDERRGYEPDYRETGASSFDSSGSGSGSSIRDRR